LVRKNLALSSSKETTIAEESPPISIQKDAKKQKLQKGEEKTSERKECHVDRGSVWFNEGGLDHEGSNKGKNWRSKEGEQWSAWRTEGEPGEAKKEEGSQERKGKEGGRRRAPEGRGPGSKVKLVMFAETGSTSSQQRGERAQKDDAEYLKGKRGAKRNRRANTEIGRTRKSAASSVENTPPL